MSIAPPTPMLELRSKVRGLATAPFKPAPSSSTASIIPDEKPLATSDILDALPANVAILDLRGVIVSVNQAWRGFALKNALHGSDFGVGQNYLEICEFARGDCSEDACAIAIGIRRVLKGEVNDFSIDYACHSLTEQRWFRMKVSPLGGEPVVGALVMHLNITESKQAEQHQRLQGSALEASANAIVITNSKGVIEWANPAFTVYTGYNVAEVIGKTPGLLKSGKHDEKFYRNLWGTISSGNVWHGEMINRRKDGSFYNEEMTITPIRDGQGEIEHFIAVMLDITERKKIEAQFLRAQRMESIGMLAGGIAHDLNNILAPIMMCVDVLKSDNDSPQTKQILETVEMSAKRGADIVRQVLSFARGVEGERVEIQPKHLLRDLEKIIKDTFPKDIRLEFSIPVDTWTVLGDPTQLHQILLNLCVNARDAMPNGGTLAIGVENCVFDEQYAAMNLQTKPGRYVCISATDTGTGIPPEILDKIFDPFFTTKELNKGTGLGLSTVMAIVKSHEGTINVYSEPGKGTTFKIYLAASELSTDGRKQQSLSISLPRGHGETVLVVDDEASILTITSQTLQAFGYRVLRAMDGAEALAVYAEHQREINVVLTDTMMPVLDGPATIHAMMRINPSVKIIAASGLNANGNVAKAAGAGVKHFLTKPYTAHSLLKTIRSVLDEK